MKGPYPPVLNQHFATLPDGSPDPAALTDCGETCCASELAAWRHELVSIGSVRLAFGLPDGSGVSGAAQFVPFLDGRGLPAYGHELAARRAAGLIRSQCRDRRRHVLALGWFQGNVELHWIVCYGSHRLGVWAMDPWLGAYVFWSWGDFRDAYAGQLVVVGR